MKMSMQCVAAMKKADSMLGIIGKGTENKTADIIMPLYKSTLQLHLEYCVLFWSPYLTKDIVELEAVQKMATKAIKGMERLPFEENFQQSGTF